ncbi:MAG: LytR C-terminal domain-containing protein [Patescibacteria group bacterium]
MEEEAQVQPIEQQSEIPQPVVGFPQPTQKKKGGFGKFVIIFLGLAILAVVAYLVFKGVSGGDAEPTATPSVESFGDTSNETIDTETPAPSPTTDKTTISVKILNGTGIAGEAGFLQDIFKTLGYSKIEVGNAEDQTQTTTEISFSSDMAQDLMDEITAKLKSVYQTVTTKTSSGQASDVVVTTGLRKGATPKPSASTKPSTSPTASPSATP